MRNTGSNPAMPQGGGCPSAMAAAIAVLSVLGSCKQEVPRARQNAAHHTLAHCMLGRDSCCKHTCQQGKGAVKTAEHTTNAKHSCSSRALWMISRPRALPALHHDSHAPLHTCTPARQQHSPGVARAIATLVCPDQEHNQRHSAIRTTASAVDNDDSAYTDTYIHTPAPDPRTKTQAPRTSRRVPRARHPKAPKLRVGQTTPSLQGTLLAADQPKGCAVTCCSNMPVQPQISCMYVLSAGLTEPQTQPVVAARMHARRTKVCPVQRQASAGRTPPLPPGLPLRCQACQGPR